MKKEILRSSPTVLSLNNKKLCIYRSVHPYPQDLPNCVPSSKVYTKDVSFFFSGILYQRCFYTHEAIMLSDGILKLAEHVNDYLHYMNSL